MGARAGALALLIATSLGGASAAAEASPPLLDRLGCGAPRDGAVVRLAPAPDGVLDILVIGSSSTAGVGARGAAAAYPALLEKTLRERAVRDGAAMAIRVVARGVWGEKASGALRRIRQALATAAPDLLVWQLGTNDAIHKIAPTTLARQLRAGVAAARARGAAVALVDPQYFPRIARSARFEATVAAIARMGDALGAPVVRRFERMRRAEALGEAAMRALLARDRFHMSPLGHACLARDLAAAIALPGAAPATAATRPVPVQSEPAAR